MNRPKLRKELRTKHEKLLIDAKGEAAFKGPGFPSDTTLSDWKKRAEKRRPEPSEKTDTKKV